MSVFIFGKEPPKISFKQAPSGEISFLIENECAFELDEFHTKANLLTWMNFCSCWDTGGEYLSHVGGMDDDELKLYAYPAFYALRNQLGSEIPTKTDERYRKEIKEKYERAFIAFTTEVAKHTETATEKKFFRDYVALCLTYPKAGWDCPALIPQVWVNWLHYDSKDKKRAERTHKEPFRVDFVFMDRRLSDDLTIIEIDGSSHYCDFKGRPSINSYTEHLRKDRWLRQQGWNVYRISTQEVNEYEDIRLFLEGLFGDTYDPWVGVSKLSPPYPKV